MGFAPFCKDRPTQPETAGLQAGSGPRAVSAGGRLHFGGRSACPGRLLPGGEADGEPGNARPDGDLLEGETRQGRAQLLERQQAKVGSFGLVQQAQRGVGYRSSPNGVTTTP